MSASQHHIDDIRPAQPESFSTGVSRIEFWNKDIVFVKIDDHAEVQLEHVTRQYETLLARYDGQHPFRVLVEPGESSSINREAREYSSVPERGDISLGTAVLVKSLAQRMIINFMIKMTYNNSTKMRMFDSKEKAIAWLLSL